MKNTHKIKKKKNPNKRKKNLRSNQRNHSKMRKVVSTLKVKNLKLRRSNRNLQKVKNNPRNLLRRRKMNL